MPGVDPIASLCISLMIGASVIPLLKSTAKTLLQSIPPSVARNYDKCVAKVFLPYHFISCIPFSLTAFSLLSLSPDPMSSQIKKIEGVIDVASPHFWALTQTQIVGTAILVVYEGYDAQSIQRFVWNSFSHLTDWLTLSHI